MAKRDDPSKYLESYPKDLDWNKRIWVLKPNDHLQRKGEIYCVKEVIKSRIKGAKPQVVLEKLENNVEI